MERSDSISFLLKWNRVVLWFFIVGYTITTLLFSPILLSDGVFSIISRLTCIALAITLLFMSYKSSHVIKNIYKYTYALSALVLINATTIAVTHADSAVSLIYFGSVTIILSLMYLDKWYLLFYQLMVLVMCSVVYGNIYNWDIIKVLIGCSIHAILLIYVALFFNIKKNHDSDIENEIRVVKRQNKLLIDSESKLKKMQEFYKSLSDSSPYRMAAIDINGCYIYINEITSMNEQMRNWVIGKTDREIFEKLSITCDSVHTREEAIKQCITTKNDVMIEDSSEDGLKFPFGRTKLYRPYLDKNGEIIKIFIYG